MCRYAFVNYKYQYTCFNCRKSFKQTTGRDLLRQNGLLYQYDKLLNNYTKSGYKDKEIRKLIEELEDKYFVRKIKCPECGNIMCNLGLDFKPPPKKKIKEWKKEVYII